MDAPCKIVHIVIPISRLPDLDLALWSIDLQRGVSREWLKTYVPYICVVFFDEEYKVYLQPTNGIIM